MSTTSVRTPFLDADSFAREEMESVPPVRAASGPWSPFLSVYEADEGENQADEPLREAYAALVNDLYDEEFDEALFELLTSARTIHEDHLTAGHSLAEADRIVTQHFSELVRESESVLDRMTREFGARDAVALEGELEAFADNYVPAAPLEPEFEDFLGKLIKKVGKGVTSVAKAAAKGVASLALGPVLNKIKALVKPLLNQVLQKAIGKLPVAVQPTARKLAERLGLAPKPPAPEPPTDAGAGTGMDAGSVATPPEPALDPTGDVGSPVQAGVGADVPEMQLEFDRQVAEAMLESDESAFELELARTRASSNGQAARPVFTDLDQARQQLMFELENLKEGESPAPYVENFLPAVLPAVNVAMKLIGRARVVNFLAGFLGKLIANLVGPQHAPALSRAMVDAGLKLVNLEAPDGEASRLASSAVVATLEETLVRVASLPNHVLDNQQLLEGFTLEAFEQAAAANLPALFADATYKKRPELLEGGVNASWVMVPLRRPRYKRCSRTFNVTITPHMAEAIEGFDGASLSEYFQDQLSLPEGEDLEAEIHLFEVIPGGTTTDIARHEAEVSGLGATDEATLSQLQPLTNEAAAVLLGKPALGRALRPGVDVRTVPPGQRVYHMVVGRRPLTVPGTRNRRRVRRLARVYVIIDAPNDQIRVLVFLSEVKTQRLAVRLRQQTHAGAIAVQFQKLLAKRLPAILHGRRPTRLRIVHPGVAPGADNHAMLGRLPGLVPPAFVARLQEWLTAAFADFVKNSSAKLLAASEHPADGVTLVFTIEHPAGLKELGQALSQKSGAAGNIAGAIANAPAPTVRVDALTRAET
jgi:hypothetical protein